jgi:glycosyltransferase involved in cell wall biosynthesis
MHQANDKRVHDKEARALHNAGFNVVHICPAGTASAAETFLADGVRVWQYPTRPGIWNRVLQLRRLYRLASSENADAYHANEVDSWFVVAALKLFKGKRAVFDVHEHYPSVFAESRFPRFLRPFVASAVRVTYRLLVPLTDRIVLAKLSVSDDFKCEARKKVLVRNFTPVGTLAIAPARTPRSEADPMTIVHLGLFNKLRGWPQVLEAIAMSDERARLLVIGTINDGTETEFKDRVRELGLADRVAMLGWMPFNEAFDHLLKADVGLIAFQPHIQNHIFAMPHKLFDYMAAGMSVLMPKQAVEVAPIVQEAQCGLLIDPADPNDIARAIQSLLCDPQAALEMGKRGQEAVRQTYNWEAEAQHLITMYKKLD